MCKYFHCSAFLDDIINYLNIKKNGIYIDCTYGCGGHSYKILNNLNSYGKLFAFDIDPNVTNIVNNNINDSRFMFINNNFIKLKYYMDLFLLTEKIDGVLFDLGISTYQLNNSNRGFSFLRKGPLDMRLNQNIGIKASEWLNKANYNEIYNVIKNLGQEKNAKKISRKIILYKRINKFNTTSDLNNLIIKNIYKRKRIHQSTKTFQAIRLFINNELNNIKLGLDCAYKVLRKGGRLVVISFNSLEDSIVKNFIMNKSNINNLLLSKIPLTNLQIKERFPIKMLNLGKYKPSLNEINNCNNIRSAILRIAQKC